MCVICSFKSMLCEQEIAEYPEQNHELNPHALEDRIFFCLPFLSGQSINYGPGNEEAARDLWRSPEETTGFQRELFGYGAMGCSKIRRRSSSR